MSLTDRIPTMNNIELSRVISTVESDISRLEDQIKNKQELIIRASYSMGANHSVNKINQVFDTLRANVENPKLTDEAFRTLTGQMLDTLANLDNT